MRLIIEMRSGLVVAVHAMTIAFPPIARAGVVRFALQTTACMARVVAIMIKVEVAFESTTLVVALVLNRMEAVAGVDSVAFAAGFGCI